MAPAQDHAPVEFSPGAGTRGLAALSGQLIDGALDQRIAAEDDLDRAFQLSQAATQVKSETTEGLDVFLPLHAIIIYSIQIFKRQEKNDRLKEKCRSGIYGSTTGGKILTLFLTV